MTIKKGPEKAASRRGVSAEQLALDLSRVALSSPLTIQSMRVASQISQIDLKDQTISKMVLSSSQLNLLMKMVVRYMDPKAYRLYRYSGETNDDAKLRFLVWLNHYSQQSGLQAEELIDRAGQITENLEKWHADHAELGDLTSHHWASVMNTMIRQSGFRYFCPQAKSKIKTERQQSRKILSVFLLFNMQVNELFHQIANEYVQEYLQIIRTNDNQAKKSLQDALVINVVQNPELRLEFQKLLQNYIGELIQSGDESLAEMLHQWLYLIKTSANAQKAERGYTDQRALRELMVCNAPVMQEFFYLDELFINPTWRLPEANQLKDVQWLSARSYFLNAMLIAAIEHPIFNSPFDKTRYQSHQFDKVDLNQIEKLIKRKKKATVFLERRGEKIQLVNDGTQRPRSRSGTTISAQSLLNQLAGSSSTSVSSTDASSDLSSNEGSSRRRSHQGGLQGSPLVTPRGTPRTPTGTPRSARGMGRTRSMVFKSTPRERYLNKGLQREYSLEEINALLQLFADILQDMHAPIEVQSISIEPLNELEKALVDKGLETLRSVQDIQSIMDEFHAYLATNAGAYFISLVGRAVEHSSISKTNNHFISLNSFLKKHLLDCENKNQFLIQFIGRMQDYSIDLVKILHQFLYACHDKAKSQVFEDSPIASCIAEVMARLLRVAEDYEDRAQRKQLQEIFYSLAQDSFFENPFTPSLYDDHKTPMTELMESIPFFRMKFGSGHGTSSKIDANSLRAIRDEKAKPSAADMQDRLNETRQGASSAAQALVQTLSREEQANRDVLEPDLVRTVAGSAGELMTAFDLSRQVPTRSTKKDNAPETGSKKRKKK